MTISQAQQRLYEVIRDFYGTEHVFWAGAKMTTRPSPYCTIQFLNTDWEDHPVKAMEGENWVTHRDINCPVDINLYTKGKTLSESAFDLSYGNTALNDLSTLAAYLESDGITEELGEMSVAIEIKPKDVSALLKESQYQYRAMMELRVGFTDKEYGRYGMNGRIMPDASGGGNEDMVTDPYVINDAKIDGGYT